MKNFNFRGIKLEVEEFKDINNRYRCKEQCPYFMLCKGLKHPIYVGDNNYNFEGFCEEYIGNGYYPVLGTLEKNLPSIFPNFIIERNKQYEDLKNTILGFCSKGCVLKCTDDCYFKKIKDEKEI